MVNLGVAAKTPLHRFEKRVLSVLMNITSSDVPQLAQSSKLEVDQNRREIEGLVTRSEGRSVGKASVSRWTQYQLKNGM